MSIFATLPVRQGTAFLYASGTQTGPKRSQRLETDPFAHTLQRQTLWPVTLLFGVKGRKTYHVSDEKRDTFVRYNAANTDMPPAISHGIGSLAKHPVYKAQAEELGKYIEGRGEKKSDISWLNNRLPISEIPYTVLDVETTGLDNNDRIVQLAALPVNPHHRPDPLNFFNEKVNPGLVEDTRPPRPFTMNPEAVGTHGITDADLADKPTIDAFLPVLRQRNQDALLGTKRLLVVYNASFDPRVINEAIRLYNKNNRKRMAAIPPELVVDAYILMQRLHPFNSQKKTLGVVYNILMGCELQNTHDAQADVEATYDVLSYTLKALQRHTVPLEWGQIAEKILIGRLDWDKYSEDDKTKLIAGFISQERPFFESRYPQFIPPPLRAIDVLRFQFGALARHDGPIAHYPTLDITLDKFGLRAGRYWDGTDQLDLDLVKEVRQERAEQNLKFLMDLFNEDFPQDGLNRLTATIAEQKGKAGNKSYQQQLQKALLNAIAKQFADKVLQRDCPADEEALDTANQQFLQELSDTMPGILQNMLVQKCQLSSPISTALEESLNAFSSNICEQSKKVLDEIGNRYLYSYQDTDLTQTGRLIDPSVIQAYKAAKLKEAKGTPLVYQNPDPTR